MVYFSAEREPAVWAALALASLGVTIAIMARRRSFGFPMAAALAALTVSFAGATLHTAWIAHPVLRHPAWGIAVTGFVAAREEREHNDRIVVRTRTMEGRGLDPAPARVRIVLRPGTAPPVGSFVTFKADLLPPLSPLRPGGYDFARDMYFSALGASGFVLGGIKTAAPPAASGGALAARPPRPSRQCATASTSASAPSFPATRGPSPRRSSPASAARFRPG